MNKTTAHHSTKQSGNAETGFITVDRELQTWADTPANGIYAGKSYMITTSWRGTTPGARHIMTNRSSAPYSR
ncbi:hypothetical protein SEA_VIBAKI_48 [Arthrobacter phage Vibaki]|uniref:Uncharacterized protein n=1 Tax=Arthrobacter phage Vibaki TaxID=2593333 RepID=A0A514TYZ7_9CAUD|nr:hypothetical protein HYP95_gp48 [Arthrobacter phage Vibaki]QDK01928.1 hypothetical protein SEA_VIBAKI_48 [Arthrobacter phage Vibaki]